MLPFLIGWVSVFKKAQVTLKLKAAEKEVVLLGRENFFPPNLRKVI